MPEPSQELREWIREIKEALGLQFSSVHREIGNLDRKVTDGVESFHDLEERVRALELKEARRDGHGQAQGSDLSINYKMIGAIISGAVGGLYVIYDLLTKHGGK